MARSGACWRGLPERFGDHRAVKRRCCRWIEGGVLDSFLEALGAEADLGGADDRHDRRQGAPARRRSAA
jgi:transposase